MALLLGAYAPDFTLAGWYGHEEGEFRLDQQRGHPVVLAFYPGDERLVCTRQMCSYSDQIADLHHFDAAVWGIAPQDVASHRQFAEGRRLTMPLLSDPDRSVARAYGVMGAFGLRRSVFVVDASGRISWRWVATLNLTFPTVEELRSVLSDVRAA